MQSETHCQATKAVCQCGQVKDHEGNHTCDCGGEWTQEGVPVVFPGGLTKNQAVDKMLNIVLGEN